MVNMMVSCLHVSDYHFKGGLSRCADRSSCPKIMLRTIARYSISDLFSSVARFASSESLAGPAR